MRTRAMASLRRPVASALPVTTGLRVACRASASAVVSVVYSDTCSAAGSPVFTLASSARACVPVDSATVSCLVLPHRLAPARLVPPDAPADDTAGQGRDLTGGQPVCAALSA